MMSIKIILRNPVSGPQGLSAIVHDVFCPFEESSMTVEDVFYSGDRY
jgi:hypothetical protein